MPVFTAVLDARVEVQSIGDTPGFFLLADASDLGIDSSSEEKGSSLLKRHSIADTLLARPLFFIGPIVHMSSSYVWRTTKVKRIVKLLFVLKGGD